MNFLLAAAMTFELNLPIFCGPSQNILEGLRERYNEEIVFMAPSVNEVGDDLFHSLWINASTKTWSFVVANKQKETLCVIASGENLQMFFPGNTI